MGDHSVTQENTLTRKELELYGFTGSRYGLSSSTLKLFAVITMLIDHSAGSVLWAIMDRLRLHGEFAAYNQLLPVYQAMRSIGRLAFPVFCFLIVEGFFHTRSVRKYCLRLFLFALLSEFPFDLALKPSPVYFGKQNVYWTLLLSLIVIWVMDEMKERPWVQGLAAVSGMMIARAMMTDYNYKGVFLIVVLYLFHDFRLYQAFGGAAAIAWEKMAPLSFILCFLYNGKRGWKMKYFFYIFYPGHLLLLGMIRYWAVPRFF